MAFIAPRVFVKEKLYDMRRRRVESNTVDYYSPVVTVHNQGSFGNNSIPVSQSYTPPPPVPPDRLIADTYVYDFESYELTTQFSSSGWGYKYDSGRNLFSSLMDFGTGSNYIYCNYVTRNFYTTFESESIGTYTDVITGSMFSTTDDRLETQKFYAGQLDWGGYFTTFETEEIGVYTGSITGSVFNLYTNNSTIYNFYATRSSAF